MSLQFEWDSKKAEANLAKHGHSKKQLRFSRILWHESSMTKNIQVTSGAKS